MNFILRISLIALTILCTVSERAIASPNGSITITVTGFQFNDGFCRIALFDQKAGFPGDVSMAIHTFSTPNPKNSVTVTFRDIPSGTYAVSILHDRNGNKRMDSNIFGMPKESYAVSNNVPDKGRAPWFSEAAILLAPGESISQQIRLKHPR